MHKRTAIKAPVTIGISLLFTVLLVLSLTTFAAISLIEAKHDLTNSRRFADRITAYQTAANRAEETLDYYQTLAANGQGEPTVTYSEPIDDEQELSVMLTLAKDKRSYEIKKWQTVNLHDWTPDETMPGLLTLPDLGKD